MKKSIIFAFLALVMVGCSKSERLLTSATGSIYECLVICEPSEKEAVCTTMGADMYGLPQMEPYFTVSHVTPAQFDDLFKSSRNILLVDVDEHKYTQTKVQHSRDVWSKPQAFIRIQAPSHEAFQAYWRENGEAVREFMLIKNERLQVNNDSVDVVWCCNNKGPMRKDVIIYSFPYTAQEQFGQEAILAMRNAVLGQIVSAQVPGSHMGTEYKHFPPQTRQVPALRDSIGGFYAMETRGLWKMLDGEAMGGPFVSLTRLDQVNGRVVTAETFIFAAGQKKRNALRQCEAILYTLKMPNE